MDWAEVFKRWGIEWYPVNEDMDGGADAETKDLPVPKCECGYDPSTMYDHSRWCPYRKYLEGTEDG